MVPWSVNIPVSVLPKELPQDFRFGKITFIFLNSFGGKSPAVETTDLRLGKTVSLTLNIYFLGALKVFRSKTSYLTEFNLPPLDAFSHKGLAKKCIH